MDAQEFRHHLHRFPELSGQEYKSQTFIKEALAEIGFEDSIAVGGTSLLLPLINQNEGPSILIRADFDALPIEEINNFQHKSQNLGVSHKCGHDGHAAILYRLAQKIKEKPLEGGSLLLLWQASEENGQGAQRVLKDPKFQAFNYDQAFALHNIPGEPLGMVLCRPENFTAGVRSLSFKFKGLETHAAHPHEGRNPAQIISKTLALAEYYTNNNPLDEDYTILTPVYSSLGAKNYGISPAEGEVHFTLRTWSGYRLDQLCEEIHEKIKRWSEEEGIHLDYQSFEEFWPNINTEKSVALVRSSAQNLNMSYQELSYPYSWGEDFGLFTKEKAGAMFGLGSGEDCPVLHHPAYDFPDALIEKASSLFYEILRQSLNG